MIFLTLSILIFIIGCGIGIWLDENLDKIKIKGPDLKLLGYFLLILAIIIFLSPLMYYYDYKKELDEETISILYEISIFMFIYAIAIIDKAKNKIIDESERYYKIIEKNKKEE